jgi:hypothetical protein
MLPRVGQRDSIDADSLDTSQIRKCNAFKVLTLSDNKRA